MGRADPKRQRGSLALFMACVRHNPENYSNGEEGKSVYFCYLTGERRVRPRDRSDEEPSEASFEGEASRFEGGHTSARNVPPTVAEGATRAPIIARPVAFLLFDN